MTFPLSLSLIGITGTNGGNEGFDIYLNRSGINSIETPKEQVTVEPEKTLRIRFQNRGAPIHITITASNAGPYTPFFHQNMYIVDGAVLDIPMRKECPAGTFDLEILSGYGAMKATIPVTVLCEPVRKEPAHEPLELPLQPVPHGRPHLLMVVMGISLILYVSWYYTADQRLNLAAFITLIIGVLYTWYRQQ
jgi:hypothetical protein